MNKISDVIDLPSTARTIVKYTGSSSVILAGGKHLIIGLKLDEAKAISNVLNTHDQLVEALECIHGLCCEDGGVIEMIGQDNLIKIQRALAAGKGEL